MEQENLPVRFIETRAPMIVTPITLTGEHVCMQPLALTHLEPLCAIGLDEELWRWTTVNIQTPEHMRAYIATALREQAEGKSLPFATTEKSTGRIVGCTRFGNIDTANRRVEIGWTWVGREWQRTAVNTEAKLLMLEHAFETWSCLRVEFKTDSLNARSRSAILRLGAKEEGTFRNHMITDSGRLRHSVYYSLIDSEWPEVKARLQQKLETAKA
ncbi:MAG: GNAT family protein [candidate division KSB1 bacterium]